MNRQTIMFGLLAVWMGGWTSAPVRDIPVFRDYSVPIVFYDAYGMPTDFISMAPDVAAARQMQEQHRLEMMVGRDAPFAISFSERSSGPLPAVGGGYAMTALDDLSADEPETPRDWLVDAMTQSLFRTGSLDRIATDKASEDDWEWLAEAVESGTLQLTPEMEQNAKLMEAIEEIELYNVLRAGPAAAPSGTASAEPTAAEIENLSAAERAAILAASASTSPGLALGGDDAARRASALPPGAGEMSQTRRIIDEMSANASADLTSWKDSVTAAKASLVPDLSLNREALGLPASSESRPGMLDSFLDAAASRAATPSWREERATQSAPWQGGAWRGETDSFRSSTGASTYSAPGASFSGSSTERPAATRGTYLPTTGGSGYQFPWQ